MRIVILLALQIVAPMLKFGVGAVALWLGRALRDPRETQNSASWWITGAAMSYLGLNNVAQSVAAACAYVAGTQSSFYDWYLRLTPAGNQSRTFLVIAMGLLLAGLAVRPERVLPHARMLAIGAMGLATCWGAAFGWAEGSMTAAHYADKALFDLFELFALFAALGFSLWKDSVDRLLWLCLATYGFYSALNVLWYSALSSLAVAGAWAPDAVYTQVYATLIHSAMLAIALHRMKLKRTNTLVPSMLDSLGPSTGISKFRK